MEGGRWRRSLSRLLCCLPAGCGGLSVLEPFPHWHSLLCLAFLLRPSLSRFSPPHCSRSTTCCPRATTLRPHPPRCRRCRQLVGTQRKSPCRLPPGASAPPAAAPLAPGPQQPAAKTRIWLPLMCPHSRGSRLHPLPAPPPPPQRAVRRGPHASLIARSLVIL